ncbi:MULTISPECIES: cyclopropane-fatty-acyl-phospholipid synthase family protein [unclassified Amycolatopsis]|uniref:SAM-dependent methyltransferase n=1 Tax=unclassified Amycolatopsis TaxID=2618356 RepID=UPI001FF1B4F0|nr:MULTISPECIES: cyclopropane-fatty-acyl-phospholipid synthase family protein [unclassified Amycolatopsis]UOZ02625.1 cyclopropane-fatty-acyl-phospholipid synthase family protein [Amycolatopsis sp. WQ 127309]WSJ78117.1 cyclopropane-fatty-acyl-phospholipid synthase family protein [Amycolatopsis sp. NBC_01307]WSK78324.1 cyclopropane-fatty-acyl-phospholipid synthase family protein [Amycolatopsis sp. NBC_01286]
MTTSSVDRASTQDVPDENRWPGLAAPPHSALRARIAASLFRRAVRPLDVRVTFPDGTVLGNGGPEAPEMRILRPEAFFHRLGVDAKIGFGESYMAGDWVASDLAEVLTPFAARMATLVPPVLQKFRKIAERTQPPSEENSLEGARANIHRHYDLSNDLFGTFLDESMMYSSALFGPADDLTAAQHRKIDSVLDYAGVRAGSEVLEIGTGWGELAIRAAARGATVTSLTISEEQRALATERIVAAGFGDRVEVKLCDYRESSGQFDAVVSVEMIEAVGASYWPAFYSTIGERLRPGGRFGLQAITMDHDRMMASSRAYTWIHKYIFPGGIIPSVRSIEDGLVENTRLRLAGMREFGQDYAHTLRLWRERFLHRWTDIAGFGFDDVFRRMWEFYLAYSEAGFRSGYLKVHQFGYEVTDK